LIASILINELTTSYKYDFKHIVITIPTDGYVLASGEKKLLAPGLFISAEAPEVLTLKMLKGNWFGVADISLPER
jgi:putative ABC transport system permease protein